MSHRFQLYTYSVLVKLLFNGKCDPVNSKTLQIPLPKRREVNVAELNL